MGVWSQPSAVQEVRYANSIAKAAAGSANYVLVSAVPAVVIVSYQGLARLIRSANPRAPVSHLILPSMENDVSEPELIVSARAV